MPVFSIAIKRLGANSKVSGSRKFFGGRSRCWSATTRASLKLLLATATSCLFWLATAHASGSQIPNYDHVVVVIMSAQQASDVVGSPSAPYINGALIDGGTLLTNSYAVSDVSQQNYWAFLSGYVQNNEVLESCPNSFTAITLASQLTDAGLSFAQYSEGLESTGSTVCAQGLIRVITTPSRILQVCRPAPTEILQALPEIWQPIHCQPSVSLYPTCATTCMARPRFVRAPKACPRWEMRGWKQICQRI